MAIRTDFLFQVVHLTLAQWCVMCRAEGLVKLVGSLKCRSVISYEVHETSFRICWTKICPCTNCFINFFHQWSFVNSRKGKRLSLYVDENGTNAQNNEKASSTLNSMAIEFPTLVRSSEVKLRVQCISCGLDYLVSICNWHKSKTHLWRKSIPISNWRIMFFLIPRENSILFFKRPAKSCSQMSNRRQNSYLSTRRSSPLVTNTADRLLFTWSGVTSLRKEITTDFLLHKKWTCLKH